ncbi:MAG TPA: pitrilysin family protein [Bryobacteraceae bacterium]|nr:pitrilysin family protein [Bryobacteraceae bacterium]
MKFTDTRLENGLRVIIAEDHYAPVYAISVSYGVGSKDERKGRTGFAHLFEHMMFKGSEKVGPGEHFFLTFNYGGSMNGTTDADRTLYFEILPKNQLDLGLFLEADRMRSLAITKENLENQRQAVKEERRMGLDNQPYGRTFERADELIYDNFAYKHSVIGSMEDLDAATVDDVKEFFRIYYAPNNAVLALVGDLDTKETLAKVKQYFGSIPRQEQPKPVDLTEPPSKAERREKLDDKLARAPLLLMAYRIPPAKSDDTAALLGLANLFGGGPSSRLYQKLVKEKEVCAQVFANTATRIGTGQFRIMCLVRPGKTLEEAEALISEEVAKLHSAPVSEAELKRMHTSVRRTHIGIRTSVLTRANWLADTAVMHNDPNMINSNLEKALAVTAADIQRVAKAHLRTDNRIVLHTSPAQGGPQLAGPPPAPGAKPPATQPKPAAQ